VADEESAPGPQSVAEKQILRFAQNDTFGRSVHEEQSLTTSRCFAVPSRFAQDDNKRLPRANYAQVLRISCIGSLNLKPAVETLVAAEVATREQLTSVATLTVWVKRGMGILGETWHGHLAHESRAGPVFAKATPWQAARATPGQLPFLG